MAEAFLVYGTEQRGKPIAELPWLSCRDVFQLDVRTWTEECPRFGKGLTRWPTNVVVRVDVAEARENGIVPGYFVSPLTPERARFALNLVKPYRSPN